MTEPRSEARKAGQRRSQSQRRALRLPSDPWTIAAALCLFGGAILLVVAWYDISGTANLYEQLPYLVSAGFSGLALIIAGSAFVIAGRSDRTERRLAQLVDALTEPAGPAPDGDLENGLNPADGGFLVTAGGRTYHRPGCLLLTGKEVSAADPADIDSDALTPCPVCGPHQAPDA